MNDVARDEDNTMGLDDFTSNASDDSEDDELKQELSKNSPPEEDTWKEEEPGTPSWLSLISGEEKQNDDEELIGDKLLVVGIENIQSTEVRSTLYISLEDIK